MSAHATIHSPAVNQVWPSSVAGIGRSGDPRPSWRVAGSARRRCARPATVTARLDRATWAPLPVFDLVGTLGAVELEELERTLNMGVGMVAVLSHGSADAAVRILTGRRVPAWVAGEIVEGDGSAELHGTYRR